MRTFRSVPRWLSAGIFALVLVLATAIPVLADTGTYGISNYTVTLEPQSSGQVKITYEQQWKVLTGDIPWVTIGLPNNNFSIDSFSGAAAKVSSDNSTGFSGVRVDLDKDYKPGQTFNIKVTVLQSNLLERLTSDKKWRINYTPGWYDRAIIDHLQINLVSPVGYQTYSSVTPTPTSVNNNSITWDVPNLSAGSRYNVTVESTDGGFLAATVPVGPSQSGWLNGTFFIIVGVIVAIGLFTFWGIRRDRQMRDNGTKERVAAVEAQMARDAKKKKKIEEGFEEYVEEEKIKPDAEGRYYDPIYGNYITPALWAATIARQHTQGQTPPPPTSGGCVACACVSCACACACACAGGGAAGCARKGLHECRTCSVRIDKVPITGNANSETPKSTRPLNVL